MTHQIITFLTRFPFPTIVGSCCAASIISALTIYNKIFIITPALLIIASLYALLKKQNQIAIFLCITAISATCTLLKIKTIQDEMALYADYLKRPITIEGTILNKKNNDAGFNQATILVSIKKIKQNEKIIDVNKKILLNMPLYKAERLSEGQSILIYNLNATQPQVKSDFYRFMLKEEIWATAFLTNEKIFIKNKKNISQARKFLNKLERYLSYPTLTLFAPLFLGKKDISEKSIAIYHQSMYWGIAHHMARSGIHLIALIGLIMFLFHYLQISFWLRYLLSIFIIFTYLHISFLSLSFLRAFIMAIIQMTCKMNQYNYSSMHALLLTTLIVIMHNPYCLLFLDFQLSFGITAAVIWFFQMKKLKTIDLKRKTIIPS